MDRKQRVKLSSDCFSEWGAVPSGVPRGTKLGPWLFILIINDLHTPGYQAWKYVDDTTLVEVVPKGRTKYNASRCYSCGAMIYHKQALAEPS